MNERREVLDVRGLLCPLPVIRLQERIKHAEEGEEVVLLATDPGVLEDIPMWCRVNGHTHVASSSDKFEYSVVVRTN